MFRGFMNWGADVVIIEEWEASLELHRVVLRQLGLPADKINSHLDRIHQRKEIIIEEAILNQIKPEKAP